MAFEVKDTGPLSWNVPITDARSGRPTSEFQRRWEQQRVNNSLIKAVTFGSGAPIGVPDDGDQYFDISIEPFAQYVGNEGVWHLISLQADDPTAIASDVAVNGTATTYMRSDAAPAVQKGSDTDFGIVQVDGTTITAAAGVISAVASGLPEPADQGDILFRGAVAWERLAAGTNGYLLQTQGAGADPQWVIAPAGGGGGGGGGGALVYLGTFLPDGTNTNIDIALPTAYTQFQVVLFGRMGPSTATVALRWSFDNGATYAAGASDYKSSSAGAASSIALAGSAGTGRQVMVTFNTAGWHDATQIPSITGTVFSAGSGGAQITGAIGGHWNSGTSPGTAATHIRILSTVAGASSGLKAYVYGLRQGNGLGGCQAKLSAAFTGNFVTPAAVAWDGADVFDDSAYHDPAVQNTRLTVPATGVYLVTCNLLVNGVAAGNFNRLYITKNGANFTGMPAQIADTADPVRNELSASGIVLLTAGDYLEAVYDLESDTSVTIEIESSFSIYRLS